MLKAGLVRRVDGREDARDVLRTRYRTSLVEHHLELEVRPFDGSRPLLIERVPRSRDALRPRLLINVALSITQPSAWEREISALAAGATRAPRAERILVAHNAPLRESPPGIRIVEAWRYLLQPEHEAAAAM